METIVALTRDAYHAYLTKDQIRNGVSGKENLAAIYSAIRVDMGLMYKVVGVHLY